MIHVACIEKGIKMRASLTMFQWPICPQNVEEKWTHELCTAMRLSGTVVPIA